MSSKRPLKNILISLPQPTEEGNPYFKLAQKLNIKFDFRKFIQVEGVSLNDFRKQSINPLDFTAVIFTSKVPVDHFFRLLTEMRIELPPDTKYFCVGEATAKYMQKYIVIRKRKLFVGERTYQDLIPFVSKHKKEKFLLPCNDVNQGGLVEHMRKLNLDVTEAIVHRTVDSDLKEIRGAQYDMICFFSPAEIKSWLNNFPDFEQKETSIAVFGQQTAAEAVRAGFRIDAEAPKPNIPSMTAAIEAFLQETSK